jgi:diguanylate cyclase (GGDEF)-like protein
MTLKATKLDPVLLHEMASILGTAFRATDVIGRLGGEEFVVAGKASSSEISHAVQRLEAATTRPDDLDDRVHSLRFSSGHVTTDVIRAGSLEDMLQRADQNMDETKRLKKSLHLAPALFSNEPSIPFDKEFAN